MRNIVKLPNWNEILECLKNNSVGRNQYISRFCNLLNNIDESFYISLDGSWGSGKTFFLKEIQFIVNSLCDGVYPYGYKEQLLKIIAENNITKVEGQDVVYFNAWEYDNDDDPILSLMLSIINDGFGYEIQQRDDVKNALLQTADIITGRNISDLFSSVNLDTISQAAKDTAHTKELIEKFFTTLSKSGHRMVILIDELDRCRPTFALKLLERLKHYCNVSNVTVVVASDFSELQNVIKSVYGSDINATKYFDKFFDLFIQLPKVKPSEYISHCATNIDLPILTKSMNNVADYFDFSLRQCERFIVATKVAIGKRNNINDVGIRMLIYYFVVPFLIGLRMADHIRYEQCINGDDTTFVDYYLENAWDLKLFGLYTCEDANTKELLHRLYQAFFEYDYSTMREGIHIGNFDIYENYYNEIMDAISLLSVSAEYSD